jgi:hypothetical protein
MVASAGDPLAICRKALDEKDPRGYRLDEPMRALVAVSQLVPKTLWKTHLVPLGMPSWKTRNSVFDAILDWMGVRADVFDGGRPNIEKILSIWFARSSPKRYQAQRIRVPGGERARGSAEHFSTSIVWRSW